MIHINSDGGARGNPGPAAIGIVIRKSAKILKKYSEKIGRATNNIAEYKALIKALELASEYTKKEFICFLDSELIVKQLLGNYKVKNVMLHKLFLKAKELEREFDKVRYVHVNRYDKFQQMADKLVNQELDKK